MITGFLIDGQNVRTLMKS